MSFVISPLYHLCPSAPPFPLSSFSIADVTAAEHRTQHYFIKLRFNHHFRVLFSSVQWENELNSVLPLREWLKVRLLLRFTSSVRVSVANEGEPLPMKVEEEEEAEGNSCFVPATRLNKGCLRTCLVTTRLILFTS